jgi:hypothetical protein
MKKIIVILILIGLGLYGNQVAKKHRQQQLFDTSEATAENTDWSPSETSAKSSSGKFKCDGRTYCSQMTSCEEATFFLENCPNVKMDGNNDGVPCEKQWCK